VPPTHEEFEHTINKGELGFILTNPGHYVHLEVRFNVTRIATFLSRYNSRMLKQFSSVIFTKKESDITTLEELKGHTLAAVSKSAFGGFQLAQETLLAHDINPLEDMNMMWLGFPHADVVKAVLAEKADAGTVRSGILENMAAQGLLDLSQLRILAPKKRKNFPLLHSVDLYPEWPFAKLPGTDTTLAEQVAINLFQMQADDGAAIKAAGAGWTIPLNYAEVHDVLRRLQVEPYLSTPLALSEFWHTYRHWIVIIIFLFLFSLFTLIRLSRTNRHLQTTQLALHKHQGELEKTIQQRTDELHQTNLALQDKIKSHITVDKTLNDGCC